MKIFSYLYIITVISHIKCDWFNIKVVSYDLDGRFDITYGWLQAAYSFLALSGYNPTPQSALSLLFQKLHLDFIDQIAESIDDDQFSKMIIMNFQNFHKKNYE